MGCNITVNTSMTKSLLARITNFTNFTINTIFTINLFNKALLLIKIVVCLINYMGGGTTPNSPLREQFVH
ncbi:TMhelix containing protein [Vibrio phage 1.244.A._10N.261.54.C3]|nr:TMhelix containing protein [Vibrio phage 1.244.A._10N.261.54.C3]AUR98828.1 TMhelix containing protein [Vibrio phage 1.255.O._10N.286.45.F1]